MVFPPGRQPSPYLPFQRWQQPLRLLQNSADTLVIFHSSYALTITVNCYCSAISKQLLNLTEFCRGTSAVHLVINIPPNNDDARTPTYAACIETRVEAFGVSRHPALSHSLQSMTQNPYNCPYLATTKILLKICYGLRSGSASTKSKRFIASDISYPSKMFLTTS